MGKPGTDDTIIEIDLKGPMRGINPMVIAMRKSCLGVGDLSSGEDCHIGAKEAWFGAVKTDELNQ